MDPAGQPPPSRGAAPTIAPPAVGHWFDLTSRTERRLGPDDPVPGEAGFLWIDLTLPAPEAIAGLEQSGLLPAGAVGGEAPAGEVSWTILPDHVRFALVGARMRGDGLVLDRRLVVVAWNVVTSLHSGRAGLGEDLRARYGGVFPEFARSHGFLLYELFGQLADDLQTAVRQLADRVDRLRLATLAREPAEGAPDLLGAVLLLRRILAHTRDLLVELASRRSAHVPETTQPYMHDIAARFDGMLADLAFSRDVLSEAIRAAESGPAQQPAPAHAGPAPEPAAGPGRPPVGVATFGRLEVSVGGAPVPEAAFGAGAARELAAALLSARRPVPDVELAGWLWPTLTGDEAGRALGSAVAELRRALGPAGQSADVIRTEAGALRMALGASDEWDVRTVLGAPAAAAATVSPEERLGVLEEALRLCRGPLCAEWPYAEWGRELREECEAAQRELRGSLAEALVLAGRPEEAIAHLEMLVSEEPESERWHRGLMRAHHDAGRRPVALRQYHTCRSVLRLSHGAEPSVETQTLYMELLRGS